MAGNPDRAEFTIAIVDTELDGQSIASSYTVVPYFSGGVFFSYRIVAPFGDGSLRVQLFCNCSPDYAVKPQISATLLDSGGESVAGVFWTWEDAVEAWDRLGIGDFAGIDSVTQSHSEAMPTGCCCSPAVIDPDNPQDTEFSVDFEGFCNPSDLCTLANSVPGPTWNNSQIGYGCDWDDPSSCQATMWRLRKFFENDTQRAWRGFFAASGGISGECGSEGTNYLNLALPKGASTDPPTLTLAIFGAGGRTWTWDGSTWNPVSTTNCSAVMPTCVRKYAIDPADIYYHMSFSQGAPGADPSLYSYSMTMSYFTGLGFDAENLSLAFDSDNADYTTYLGTGDVSAGEVTLLFFKRGSISYSPPRLIYGSPTGAVSNLYFYGPNATYWQRTQFGGSGIPENGDHWAQVTSFSRSP